MKRNTFWSSIKSLIKKYRITNYLGRIILSQYIYVRYFYFRNKKFQKNSNEVLLRAKMALESCDIEYWLDSGTLLGVIRDNSLLKNDLDIDIGVWLKDYSPKIEQSMAKYGFYKKAHYEIDNKSYGLEETYVYNDVSVDLFYFSSNGKSIYSHVFVPFPGLSYDESIRIKGGLLPVEQYYPDNGLTKVEFLEKLFGIPNQPEAYLEYHYGEDYRTPRKWSYENLETDNKNAKYLYEKLGVIHIHKS
jgi:hypothetical protein